MPTAAKLPKTQEKKIKEMAASPDVKFKTLKKYIADNCKDYVLTPAILGRIFEKYVGIDTTKEGHEDAFTDDVPVSDLAKIHPSFVSSNGCQWARSHSSYLGKKYAIVREQDGGRVASVRLAGANPDLLNKCRSIDPKIYAAFAGCACVMCGTHSTIEVDHKDGRYDNERNASADTQVATDFQPLCKHDNDTKRQRCKECKATGKRFDAKELGYPMSWTEGGEDWDEEQNCHGCFYYDIADFRAHLAYSAEDDD